MPPARCSGSALSLGVASEGAEPPGSLHACALLPANQRRSRTRRGWLFFRENSDLLRNSFEAVKRWRLRGCGRRGGSGGDSCTEAYNCGRRPLGCFPGVRRGAFVPRGNVSQGLFLTCEVNLTRWVSLGPLTGIWRQYSSLRAGPWVGGKALAALPRDWTRRWAGGQVDSRRGGWALVSGPTPRRNHLDEARSPLHWSSRPGSWKSYGTLFSAAQDAERFMLYFCCWQLLWGGLVIHPVSNYDFHIVTEISWI